MIPMAHLLDAPANPARALAAALQQSLQLTATPTLLPSATPPGAWTVLFGSVKDAAAAFAENDLSCFGRPVRIVRIGDSTARANGRPDEDDGGYVVRFSDFVGEMEAREQGAASTDDNSSAHANDRTGGAKRSRSSAGDEPLPKRSRVEIPYRAMPIWQKSAKSAADAAAGG